MANARLRAPMSRRSSANLILKEGFLYKKGGMIKSWSRRYFILSRESLCYFKREFQAHVQEDGGLGMEPLGRIFLTDVVAIDTEGIEKKKAFVFALHTRKRAVLLQASNTEDMAKWVEAIRKAKETDKEAEKKDPFRKTLRKLAPGLKRVTLIKDPDKGIGCTIKNAAGHILVNRIIENGPIAQTGVLRPGDELLDIHGTTVTGLQVSEVVAVIRASPNEFLATVRPITALKKGQDMGKIIYSDILPQSLVATPPPPSSSSPKLRRAMGNGSSSASPAAALVGNTSNDSPSHSPEGYSPAHSLEDFGNYDDEDEGDSPPPLPPRTEDALILVDPPPLPHAVRHPPPPVPPKPRGDEELTALVRAYADKQTKLQKSRSYEKVDEDEAHGHRRPVHVYEEIKPALNYVDIDTVFSHTRS